MSPQISKSLKGGENRKFLGSIQNMCGMPKLPYFYIYAMADVFLLTFQ